MRLPFQMPSRAAWTTRESGSSRARVIATGWGSGPQRPSASAAVARVHASGSPPVANMEALTSRHGPSPEAFLVVPMVGAFFIDIANALVLSGYLTLPVLAL